MSEANPAFGKIFISHQAIARIAYHAALQSYGIVGMVDKNLVNGITRTITHDPTRGIEVHNDEQGITIDLYIVIEYGTRIMSVTSSVVNTVRFSVEKALGMPVAQINVHVNGLRVSDLD
jgi:uncharacterized alkaline shock family protein YloU